MRTDRRKLMIPKYEVLEYIQMTNGYINTDILGNQDSRIILTSKCDEIKNNSSLVSDGKDVYFGAGGPTEYQYYSCFNDTKSFIDGTKSRLNKHTFEISKKGFYIDDKKETDFSNILDFVSKRPFIIGAFNCACTIWKVTFYNKDKRIADFIPVKRKLDGVFGMYDIVGRKFYTSPNLVALTGG